MEHSNKIQLLNPNDLHFSADYIEDVRSLLNLARTHTKQVVNTLMIQTYWLIGKRIVEEEQNGQPRARYGDQILKNLSRALTGEFGSGFSYANLRNFRQFFLTYSEDEICYALRSKLSWTHHRLIMRVPNPKARLFYIKEAEEQKWNTRELERNINTFYFERLLSTQKEMAPADFSEKEMYDEFIKDPYVFEFLNIPYGEVSEKEIENRLIFNIEKFLLELGKGFSFVGRQFKISTETSHFFIDLVFYNYILKCFVLIDLKTSKLTHQDIGQMDMYRRLFDDLLRPEGDNPTIGLLLCAERDETVVKYSVMNDNQQMFASKYLPFLPTEQELIAEIEREKLQYRLHSEDEKNESEPE